MAKTPSPWTYTGLTVVTEYGPIAVPPADELEDGGVFFVEEMTKSLKHAADKKAAHKAKKHPHSPTE